MFLLAQLVAPPLQQGPVRLPDQRPAQERPLTRPDAEQAPAIDVGPTQPATPAAPAVPAPTAPAAPPEPVPLSALPAIEGLTLYSREQLRTILATCSRLGDPAERLQACAAALTARFVADGYVNSRVYVQANPAPGRLEVVEGRLVELRVSGNDAWLNRRVARLMRGLKGQILHLPTLERHLQLLRRVPGVKQARGNLTRLGSDPTQASLSLALVGGAPSWQGDLAIRNDGSNGSGEARGVASFVKPGALTSGDILLFYGELNSDTTPELGAAITSLTYTLPLGDAFNLTGAFGYSNRNLIELPDPADGFSTNQLQGLGQLEWVFSESLMHRWAAFVGLSGNWSTTTLDGSSLPAGTPEIFETPSTGYLKLGLSGSGQSSQVGWGGNAYLLAGVPAFSSGQQQQEWRSAGVDPGNAYALGALLSAAWAPTPSLQFTGRLAGQWAFNPLLPSMQFTLGSDVGLRGLPGQLISGDSGWLALTEASWTFWQQRSNTLQLVPFIGAGGINTAVNDVSFTDTVGSGGVLIRWLTGSNWAFELGYAHQFNVNNNPGSWNDWVLDNGLYAKASYRF
ncbi:MAG: ShlB/FhaC/HecB family hemolysin secretion/activation protein [Vulcanococcus sp.]